MKKPEPWYATIYDELNTRAAGKPSRLETLLKRAGAVDMTRSDVERIIVFALLDWNQLCQLRGIDATPAGYLKQNPKEPACQLERILWTISKHKDALAVMVPAIRNWFGKRDELQIQLARDGKPEGNTVYDIQAVARQKMPTITDEQVQKRYSRLRESVSSRATGRKTGKTVR